MPDDWLETPPETPGAKEAGKHSWEGQCGDCGFLCAQGSQDHLNEFHWSEIDSIRRLKGDVFNYGAQQPDGSFALASTPACFVHATGFLQEIMDISGEIPRQQDDLEAVSRRVLWKVDRGCPKWFVYVPGQSPEKHFERKEMLELEEARLANNLKMTELQQQSSAALLEVMAAHKEVSEATKIVAEDHKVSFERSDALATKFQVAFIVLALLTFIVAVLPLAYPNGIGWLVDNAPGRPNTAVSTRTPPPTPLVTPTESP